MTVIRPTFAQWQASRGIIPWTWLHGISALAELVDRIVGTLLETVRFIVSQFQPAFELAAQAFNELAAALVRGE